MNHFSSSKRFLRAQSDVFKFSDFSFTIMYNNDKHQILTSRWNQHLLEKSLKKVVQQILFLIDLLFSQSLQLYFALIQSRANISRSSSALSVDILKQLLVFFNKESNQTWMEHLID